MVFVQSGLVLVEVVGGVGWVGQLSSLWIGLVRLTQVNYD